MVHIVQQFTDWKGKIKIKTMIVDTHTHLYLSEFDEDHSGKDAVNRAIEAGVGKLIFPNVDLNTIAPMKSLAAQFPDNVRMAMGLHPTEVKEGWHDDVSAIIEEFKSANYIAIGEIGIDLYWDKTFEGQQMQAFEQQLAFAQSNDLPIIIHCRDGLDQALEVLRQFQGVRGVFHSFGGNNADVEKIRNVGDYYFGINGIVTFKNCKVRDVIPEITLDRLLLETDAPYLAPVPHRGKRNESAYIVHTAQHIADHLALTLEAVAQATTSNAYNLFGSF